MTINELDMDRTFGNMSMQLFLSVVFDLFIVFLVLSMSLELVVVVGILYAIIRTFWVHVLLEGYYNQKHFVRFSFVISLIPYANFIPVSVFAWMYKWRYG